MPQKVTFIEKQPKLNMYRLFTSGLVGGVYLAPWIHIWFSKGIPMISQKLFSKAQLSNKLFNTFASMTIDQTINSA